MKKSNLFKKQLKEIETIQRLTSALESVSSIRIAQIKDKVLPGRECFDELWKTYSQLRVDPEKNKRFVSSDNHRFSNGKTLYVIITSDGSLSGTIDQKIVDYFLTARESADADIVCIGSHGSILLHQRGLVPVQTFHFPDPSDQAQLQAISKLIVPYAKITVYYQSYESLSQQSVKTIDLISTVATLGKETGPTEEVISSRDYIFEPSLKEIIKVMESTMLLIALREVMLDSQLAQFASRFVAMLAAEEKAKKSQRHVKTAWHKARRDERDKQQRERVLAGGMS